MVTLFAEPQHPYLQALLRSTPQFGPAEGERLEAIAGMAYKRGCAPEQARAAART